MRYPAAHRLLLCHCAQAANGSGAFSDYSSSVPSTPSISQRELRIETIAASNTPTPIRKQSKRRSNIFTVSSGTGMGSSKRGWHDCRETGQLPIGGSRFGSYPAAKGRAWLWA